MMGKKRTVAIKTGELKQSFPADSTLDYKIVARVTAEGYGEKMATVATVFVKWDGDTISITHKLDPGLFRKIGDEMFDELMGQNGE